VVLVTNQVSSPVVLIFEWTKKTRRQIINHKYFQMRQAATEITRANSVDEMKYLTPEFETFKMS